MYHFNIPDNYWKYIQKLNIIISSNKTDNEKKRQKAELDGNYKEENRDKIVWRISIPKDKIPSYIHFDSEFIPFADSENNNESEPTTEELSDAISFLKELIKQNET